MSTAVLEFLVDLLIWNWAWLSMPLAAVLAGMALLPRTRRIAALSSAWAVGGGVFWISACHFIDWLDRGVWLLALPVAYRHEFGSGFFYVGIIALVIFSLKKPTSGPAQPAASVQSAL